MLRIVLCIAIFICAILIGCGSDEFHQKSMRSYQRANQLYEQGDYRKAAEAYEYVAARIHNGDVYYNLGNTYFKIGEHGKAILYYERAKRLMPRDADVKKKLALALSLNINKQPAGVPFISVIQSVVTINEFTILAFFCYLALAGAFIVYVFIDDTQIQKIACRVTIFFAIVLLFCIVFLILLIYEGNVSKAIVLFPEVIARSAPDDGAAEIFTLHEGTMIEISEQRERWSKIQLPNGNDGWIPNSAIEQI